MKIEMVSRQKNMKRERLHYLGKEMKSKKIGYLFAAPFAILFLTFTVLPVAISIFFSFTYYNVLEAPVFIGLKNYIRLFLEDDVFIIALKNTLLFASITGPISYIACLLFAWMINEHNINIL